jgi:LVIVD repeat
LIFGRGSLAALAAALVVLVAAPGTAWGVEGEHSPNMRFVGNLPYKAAVEDGTPNFGTDIEFAEIAGRRYALAGSYENGMQIVDITDPENARIAAVYDCNVTQGDVQVFSQADKPGRTFATYTSDTYGNTDSDCYREAKALGFEVAKPAPSATDPTNDGKNGTFVVELTDPLNPRTVSFVEVAQGSHNQTVHPSGDYLYNSNADLMTSFQPAIEVYDISDFSAPKQVADLALPTRPGLGTESHDISFGKGGDRAYSAALSQGVIIDTSDPAKPEMLTSYLDPAINVWHQSEPVRIGDKDYLITEDEFAGAAGGPVCPSGGFHVYDVTGENEAAPVKVGYWNIEDVGLTHGPENTCTAHVFRIHPEEQLMTVAFYNGGVRVVDLSGLADGSGMKEVGKYRIQGADTWSAKTPEIAPNGDFYLFGNDIARGLDIYKFTASAEPSDTPGTWLGGVEARTRLATRPKVQLKAGRDALFCIVGR